MNYNDANNKNVTDTNRFWQKN